jgi:hypothetical protein
LAGSATLPFKGMVVRYQKAFDALLSLGLDEALAVLPDFASNTFTLSLSPCLIPPLSSSRKQNV